MVQDTIKVQNVSDVGFEILAIACILVWDLFQRSDLSAGGILIKFDRVFDFFLFLIGYLKLSLYFGKSYERLFLKLFNPLSSGLDRRKDCGLDLWKKFEPFLIKRLLNLLGWYDHIDWLLIIILTIVDILLNSKFV